MDYGYRHVADPYCGGVFTAGFCIPIFLFSGDKDPVGNYGKGVTKLFHTYKKHGIKDVTMKLYPEGRHESLNEINRDEVMTNVVKWLDKNVK